MLNNKKKNAFTITELVIVIAVIAILAAVLIPTFSTVVDNAKESVAMQEARNTMTNYTSDKLMNSEEVGELLFVYNGFYFSYTDGSFNPKAIDAPADLETAWTLVADTTSYGKATIYTKKTVQA